MNTQIARLIAGLVVLSTPLIIFMVLRHRSSRWLAQP